VAQHYTYTAADFERYHAGKMSETEMHALEKAALEDAFLADALEGYANTTTSEKDIAELKQKLFTREKRENILPVILQQNNWLKIAAMLVLIAGIGYMAYVFNFNNKEDIILAKKTDSNSIKNIEQKPLVFSDTIDRKDMTVTFTPEVKSNDQIKKETSPTTNRQQTTEPVAEKSFYQNDQTLSRSELSQLQKNNASRDMNIVQGIVVDNLGKPVSNATIKDKAQNIITISDSSGRFTLPVSDSSTVTTISIQGYCKRICQGYIFIR